MIRNPRSESNTFGRICTYRFFSNMIRITRPESNPDRTQPEEQASEDYPKNTWSESKIRANRTCIYRFSKKKYMIGTQYSPETAKRSKKQRRRQERVRKRRGGGTWWCSWSRSSRRTSRPRTRPALWSGRLWWKESSSSGRCESFRSSNFLKPIERGRRRASSRSLRRRKMKSAWPFSLSLSCFYGGRQATKGADKWKDRRGWWMDWEGERARAI